MTTEITPSRAATSRDLKRARVAVAVLFFTNGALFANLLPRYPEIKAALGLGNGAFGLALAAFPAGALIAALAAGPVIRRFRSSVVAVAGTVLLGVGVWVASIAPTGPLFAAALFVAGATDALTDVAQNAHGLRVQRVYGRSILNSFHATWSVGGVVGGLMGGVAAGLGVPLSLHLVTSAVVASAMVLVGYRALLPGEDPAASCDETGEFAARRARVIPLRTGLALLAFGLIAAGGSVVEDAGNSWAALYLSGSLQTSAVVAALGFVALVGSQFIGRVVGDRQVDRFGERTVARLGAATITVGMSAALIWPSVPMTIIGFAAAGIGIATLVPSALHAANELPGLRPGTGLGIVNWLMRIGFLGAPVLVGWVADEVSLRAGLVAVPVVGVLVFLLASVLPRGKVAQA